MTADKFATQVRAGQGTLGFTNAVLYAEGYKVRGQGILRITADALEVDLEIESRSRMPSDYKGLWGEKDFWRLTGIVEGELHVVSDRVSPGTRRDHWRLGKSRTVQTLIPSGFELVSSASRRKAANRISKVAAKFPRVRFEAVFVHQKAVFVNAGTINKTINDFDGTNQTSEADTFIDRGKDYDIGLIERDADLHLILRSKAGFRSTGAADDKRRFRAVLNALGFTHGFQAWPFRLTQWRGGSVISDYITAPRILTDTVHAPFDRALGFGPGAGRKGVRGSPIRLAAEFFEREKGLSKKLAHLLFLFRAANPDSVEFGITTLALCSLFEGIVDLLFDHLKLERELKESEPHFAEYVGQRDRLCRQLEKDANQTNQLGRLAARLKYAEAFRVKDKFRALCRHFDLPYKPDMKKHLDSWAARRNALSHGEWHSSLADFVHQSRIAGGINILFLKLIGFSGRIRAVALGDSPEERYRLI
jgi:hypothetical protein